jgi:hypothetical protein
MPNHIKHGTSTLASVIKGDQNFGISGQGDYGPTSSSGFYQGITPPSLGYTIYVDRVSGGPSIHVANNDTQCIFFLKSFGATGSTISEVLAWATAQTSLYVATADFTSADLTSLITSGLTLNLNTKDSSSYPGTGTTWYDVSGNGYNATMNGTVPFTSGSPGYFSYANTNIRFDGNNSLASKLTNAITIISVAYITDISQRSVLFSKYKTTTPYGYLLEVGTASGAWTNTLRYYAGGSNVTNVDLRGVANGVTANTTYMFSVTHDIPTSTEKLYLNSTQLSATPAADNLSTSDTTWTQGTNNYIIGSYQPYFAIYSSMRQYAVFVYNRALSSTEITNMYNYLKPLYNIS